VACMRNIARGMQMEDSWLMRIQDWMHPPNV
jgi:hypothetical protein